LQKKKEEEASSMTINLLHANNILPKPSEKKEKITKALVTKTLGDEIEIH
jgi:hypothetical protein